MPDDKVTDIGRTNASSVLSDHPQHVGVSRQGKRRHQKDEEQEGSQDGDRVTLLSQKQNKESAEEGHQDETGKQGAKATVPDHKIDIVV